MFVVTSAGGSMKFCNSLCSRVFAPNNSTAFRQWVSAIGQVADCQMERTQIHRQRLVSRMINSMWRVTFLSYQQQSRMTEGSQWNANCSLFAP